MARDPKVDLHETTVTHRGRQFKTGLPVTFPYMRNTVSARSIGLTTQYLREFQAHIEPAGIYMILDETPNSPVPSPEWEKGSMTFRNPLVIKFNAKDNSRYDENSWKMTLSKAFRKQRSRALTAALKAAGYDGIVTVSEGYTSEIIKL